ncbi:hypothetical protein TNCT_137841 [Trichonephila clavata]|uniref:Uncharacterized protein n=1 Tax=Trichonephila clavata TaxID=2740835 RepID=A0A8X6KK47_TRICU|nr:hypothetical protein TNCT_137841 [Trichonephila clavata]
MASKRVRGEQNNSQHLATYYILPSPQGVGKLCSKPSAVIEVSGSRSKPCSSDPDLLRVLNLINRGTIREHRIALVRVVISALEILVW